ncbi:hypothetical protein ACFL6X_03655 [Candidatus Latescibacterota bacterium]
MHEIGREMEMLRKELMYGGAALLLTVSLPGLAHAQITVSGSAWGDTCSLWGRTVTEYVSGPFTISIGATGGPQAWDFSALAGTEVAFTDTFLDPRGGPLAEFYPDANLIRGTLILKASPSGLETLGWRDGRYHFVHTPPIPSWKWPLTLGSSWVGHSTIAIGEADVTYTVENVVDAWGTVKVPAGALECVRVRIHNVTVWPDRTEGNYDFRWLSEDGRVLAAIGTDEWREDPDFSVDVPVRVYKSSGTAFSPPNCPTAVSGCSWGEIKSLLH